MTQEHAPCNCAQYGHARLCPHHTQEDFDAADRAIGRTVESDVHACTACGLSNPNPHENYCRSCKAPLGPLTSVTPLGEVTNE